MNFTDQIKERKENLKAARQVHDTETSYLINSFEYRIEELDTDLELEKELTEKLKGLLDGGLVDLVGELVEHVKQKCKICESEIDLHNSVAGAKHMECPVPCQISVLIAKAKEATP